MNYLTALAISHRELLPNNYVEIGCRHGKSLSLARCQCIGIDPDFAITFQLEAPTRIFKMTSDRFFSQYDLKSLLHGPVDLAFIDGMHHAEFVLRDFINIEKNSHAGTVIMMDDVLPDRIELTTRERMGAAVWTGDVYKVITILRQYRPDLEVGVLDVDVKGLACVTRLNSASTKLSESYDAIEKAILSGEYELKSVESIRQRANPISANQITRLLQDRRFPKANIGHTPS